MISDFLARVQGSLSTGLDDMEAIFDRRWRSARILDRDGSGEQRDRARGLAHAFWENNHTNFGRPLKLEARFRVEIGDHRVEGIVDRIEDLGSGEVEVIDYKSGRAPDGNPAGDSLQLSIYALACRDHWQLHPRRVSLYYLGDNTTSTAEVDRHRIDSTRTAIDATAGRISAADFPPNSDERCASCDFVTRCEFGQNWMANQP